MRHTTTDKGSRNAWVPVLAIGCALGGMVHPAAAEEVIFQRFASPDINYANMYDARVRTGDTVTPAGNPTVIYVNHPTGARLVSYFDISGGIPAGSSITQATLKYDFYNGKNILAPVGVFKVTTDWVGGTAWVNSGGDWTDSNGAPQGSVAFATVQANVNGWFSWDVTSMVQGWVDDPSSNYGCMLIPESSASSFGQTYASGHSSSGVHPELLVTYTTGPPPPPVDNPPTGTISINGGAAATSSINVILTLAATDDEGPVVDMQFSNDDITYSTPEAYATTKQWPLISGDGPKTVSVKFSDTAGQWSTPVSATIVLDTTGPILSITSPLDQAIIVAP